MSELKNITGKLFEKENNELEVTLPVEFFNEILKSANVKGFETIPIEFFDNQVRIRSYSYENTEYMNIMGDSKNLQIKSEGYLIAPVTEMIGVMRKFVGDITISWKPSEKICIKDSEGNEAEIVPKDLNELAEIPREDRIYPVSPDGLIMYPSKDAEGNYITNVEGKFVMVPMATQVNTQDSELQKGIIDMNLVKSDYAIFNFSPEGSFVSSGRYFKKGNSSKSVILAEVKGPQTEVMVGSILKNILQVMTGFVKVQSDKNFKMVFFTRENNKENYNVHTRIGVVQYEPKETE